MKEILSVVGVVVGEDVGVLGMWELNVYVRVHECWGQNIAIMLMIGGAMGEKMDLK